MGKVACLDRVPRALILETWMTTLSQSILAAKRERGLALMPFIAAGYPNLADSMKLLPALERGGASAIELGFPFSDPIADGPVIQQAFTDALALGLKIEQIFTGLAGVRDQFKTPVVAMVSYSIVYRYGLDRFVKDAKSSGFGGLLLPDLPPPEAEYVCDKIRAGGLDTVLLISPSTTAARRAKIANLCSGFVYYLSLAGTTGERDKLPIGLEENVRQIKELTDTPVCVGFGISKPEHMKQLSAVADGAIVGTAFVRRVKDAPDAAVAVESYARELLAF
ncbi:MAG: Tryptophan synthase alpha chain [Phycisphaerales bacterium]|nr:Tryptophan synthase alpha chain [Phycisphaerales bacterium]